MDWRHARLPFGNIVNALLLFGQVEGGDRAKEEVDDLQPRPGSRHAFSDQAAGEVRLMIDEVRRHERQNTRFCEVALPGHSPNRAEFF